jgi:DNA-directed RNA polymerase specialized sigma24 family protein
MTSDHPCDEIMAQLRCADDDAARAVFERFASRLIALARGRLGARLRRKVDPEDVVQSAFRSFFAAGGYPVESWDNLWSLLVVITLRKVNRRVAYFRAACRDVDREAAAPGDAAPDWEALSGEPTPEAAAILAETVENLLARLKEWERSIVTMTLEGYAPAEISAKIGRSERTVYRVLEQIKRSLEAGVATERSS